MACTQLAPWAGWWPSRRPPTRPIICQECGGRPHGPHTLLDSGGVPNRWFFKSERSQIPRRGSAVGPFSDLRVSARAARPIPPMLLDSIVATIASEATTQTHRRPRAGKSHANHCPEFGDGRSWLPHVVRPSAARAVPSFGSLCEEDSRRRSFHCERPVLVRSATYAALIAPSAVAAMRTVGSVGRMTEKGRQRQFDPAPATVQPVAESTGHQIVESLVRSLNRDGASGRPPGV